MRKYKPQGTEMIKSLERQIQKINLADSIIEARLKNGIDRVPYDICNILVEIESLSYMDDESIFCMLVSHTDENLKRIPGIPEYK